MSDHKESHYEAELKHFHSSQNAKSKYSLIYNDVAKKDKFFSPRMAKKIQHNNSLSKTNMFRSSRNNQMITPTNYNSNLSFPKAEADAFNFSQRLNTNCFDLPKAYMTKGVNFDKKDNVPPKITRFTTINPRDDMNIFCKDKTKMIADINRSMIKEQPFNKTGSNVSDLKFNIKSNDFSRYKELGNTPNIKNIRFSYEGNKNRSQQKTRDLRDNLADIMINKDHLRTTSRK